MRSSNFYLVLFAAILLAAFTIIINAHAFYEYISLIFSYNDQPGAVTNSDELIASVNANAAALILYFGLGTVIFALGVYSLLVYIHFYSIEKKINKDVKGFYFAKFLSILIPIVMLLMIAAKAKTDFQFAFIAMELVHSILQGLLILVSMFLLVGISMIYKDYVRPRIKAAYSIACLVAEHGYAAFNELLAKASSTKLIGIFRAIFVAVFAGVVCKYLVYESVITLLS
ncbi:hypothetical protein ALP05_00683 [Pseudomonas caricapapayae]|uniref:Uncharacterized protein n=1 Tax=Pseudomonas caricapapayae TaxID=46678 RepID=A0A3M6F7N4_9PSED|nr:hypothetical protein [Pseudomonas caricapapayae]RMV76463.1 hypothetical protein ALP05_00683 [Pseudomonas caricapapayae]